MKITPFLASVVTVSLLAPGLGAADFVASAFASNELFHLDSLTGQSTLIGSYQTVDPDELGIPVLARAPDGTLYGISFSQVLSRVYRLDEQTGAATPVLPLTFAPVWPVAAAIDPTDGSLFFSNTYGFVSWPTVERVDLSTGQHQPFGNVFPPGDQFHGFAFTPNGQLYTLNLTQNALWKVNKTSPVNSSMVGGGLGPAVDVSEGGSITYDSSLGAMVGYESKAQRFFTIDVNTGLATPMGPAPIHPLVSDFAGDVCATSGLPYGPSCPGQGGFVPQLELSGCAIEGQQVVLLLSDAPGPSTALLFFGATTASIPVGSCSFLVSPTLVTLTVPLGGSGPGTGSLALPGLLPPGSAGASFTMQAWVSDPTSPVQWNGTNGIQVTVGS